jgi:hypothetical protein
MWKHIFRHCKENASEVEHFMNSYFCIIIGRICYLSDQFISEEQLTIIQFLCFPVVSSELRAQTLNNKKKLKITVYTTCPHYHLQHHNMCHHFHWDFQPQYYLLCNYYHIIWCTTVHTFNNEVSLQISSTVHFLDMFLTTVKTEHNFLNLLTY